MDKDCRQALELLKCGAAQTTRSFRVYVSQEGHPYDVHARILRLLARLKKDLDDSKSQWELKRLSKRGQQGLYRLVERKQDNHASQALHTTTRQ